jgi:ribose transport system ATP-binding protein
VSASVDVAVPAVAMRGICKAFDGSKVLEDVDFELARGEVHALVGENGAGKSTLMKILQGVYSADEGEIAINGKWVKLASAEDAKAHGIAMTFQEFSLIPSLTVAQNVFLTREPRTRAGLLDDREADRRVVELFAEWNIEIDPRARLENMSTAYWQLTEIAKALSQDAKIFITDEPTSSLAGAETQMLIGRIRALRERGISIIYISHRMEEIFQVADRITVLRDGCNVVTAPREALSMAQVVDHIVGRKTAHAFEWKARETQVSDAPLLEVKDLVATGVDQVSLQLRAGEIVGIAGLMGSGRTELVNAIFGISSIDSGEIWVKGSRIEIRRPSDAIAAGICLIPEDRRVQGLVLEHAIRDNLLLPSLEQLVTVGAVDDRRGRAVATDLVADFNIRTRSVLTPARLLSGGNQQKAVIAKWFATAPQIVLMDEPTAGVDVGAKGEIIELIRQLADDGRGILIISSELPELLAVSDRLLVMRDGRVDAQLDRRELASEEDLHHIIQRSRVAAPAGEP